MSVNTDPFPAGVRVELTTRLGQKFAGNVICFDQVQQLILLNSSVDEDSKVSDIHLVNLKHVSDVKYGAEQSQPKKTEFFNQKLNSAKLESRRRRNVEDKRNEAYAHSEDIDPVGRDLYSLIKKQLPDGLRWVNKDIEVQGVKISPPYEEKNAVVTHGNQQALNHIRNIIRYYHSNQRT